MNKLTIFISVFFAGTCIASAQRNCGTMDYLELRKKQDPALEQRMAVNEAKTQQWIREHPLESDFVKLPAIPGFIPTGNIAHDRLKYAAAKKQMLDKEINSPSPAAVEQVKSTITADEKRKRNKFIVN